MTADNAENVALRQAILAQKAACRYAPPTAVDWAEGYVAALDWVLSRLDGLLHNDGCDGTPATCPTFYDGCNCEQFDGEADE